MISFPRNFASENDRRAVYRSCSLKGASQRAAWIVKGFQSVSILFRVSPRHKARGKGPRHDRGIGTRASNQPGQQSVAYICLVFLARS